MVRYTDADRGLLKLMKEATELQILICKTANKVYNLPRREV